ELSPTLGQQIVFVYFDANGLALASATQFSLTAYDAVVAGCFVLRLGAIVAAMVGLAHSGWFSRVGFGLAVVPGIVALLALELRLYARGIGRGSVLPPSTTEGVV